VHKAGFVNILGRPNAGKSTLMNCLVGEDLSVTHSKAQTTRHRILGILNGEDYQMVYSDTPGVMDSPAYKLQEAMMEMVHGALRDADVFLLVVDVNDKGVFPEHLVQRMEQAGKPVVVCLNKIDASDKETLHRVAEYWSGRLPKAEIIPVSAKHKFHIDQVLRTLLRHLPEHPPYFEKDQLNEIKKNSYDKLDNEINTLVKNIATILHKDKEFIDKYVNILRNMGVFNDKDDNNNPPHQWTFSPYLFAYSPMV
jgi:GTP-binding protein Era